MNDKTKIRTTTAHKVHVSSGVQNWEKYLDKNEWITDKMRFLNEAMKDRMSFLSWEIGNLFH